MQKVPPCVALLRSEALIAYYDMLNKTNNVEHVVKDSVQLRAKKVSVAKQSEQLTLDMYAVTPPKEDGLNYLD